MSARLRFEDRDVGLIFSRLAVKCLAASLLLCATVVVRGQQKEQPAPQRPTRLFNVQGQVSLPEGMPAGQILVTLISRQGLPRQTYTTEQGRFEFSGIPEGGYSLSAKSMADSSLVSETVDTDTNNTATGNLQVNLTLRRESNGSAVRSSNGVISAAEAEQKVPKEARRAFRDGVRFRRANEPDKALANYGRAVEIYPEYFQALAERGDLLVTERRLAEALSDFERALKINPRYGPALRGAGYCKLESREFAEAADYLEKATTAQPDNANIYLLLGIAYLESDRLEPARLALFKALSFNTQHELRAYIYLGNLYARGRQYKEAAEMLQKYLEANPKASDAEEIKAIESKWLARAASP